MLPEEGEEGLLMLLLTHAHRRINIKATRIHLLHHGVDDSAAPSATPALENNNNGLLGLSSHTLHLTEALAQNIHNLIIVALRQFLLHIQLFQHTAIHLLKFSQLPFACPKGSCLKIIISLYAFTSLRCRRA